MPIGSFMFFMFSTPQAIFFNIAILAPEKPGKEKDAVVFLVAIAEAKEAGIAPVLLLRFAVSHEKPSMWMVLCSPTFKMLTPDKPVSSPARILKLPQARASRRSVFH